MSYPEIFDQFQRKTSSSDGKSIYDFLGGKIDASFKHSWDRNLIDEGTRVTPGYPPLSEWTADWIASLVAAKTAGNHFTIVELGAGYGQWMVAGLMAYKTVQSDGDAFGLAVEADPTHYEWLHENVESNLAGLTQVETDLLHAAAGKDGSVTFPVIENPSKDYGASYSLADSYEKTVEVPCLSLPALYRRLPERIVDMLHIDIQGAEADLIEGPEFIEKLRKTRVVLFGTHRSTELHDAVRARLLEAGLVIKLDWPRNGMVETDFGSIKTNDGALLAMDEATASAADSLMDFSRLGSS